LGQHGHAVVAHSGEPGHLAVGDKGMEAEG
jgi:hypothetical protein